MDPRDKTITDKEVIDIAEAFAEAEEYIDSHSEVEVDIDEYLPEE